MQKYNVNCSATKWQEKAVVIEPFLRFSENIFVRFLSIGLSPGLFEVDKSQQLINSHFVPGFIHTKTLATLLTIVLLQSLLPCCQMQEISPDTVTSSAPVATSPVATTSNENRQSQQTGEGFFVNGSSYAVISETLKLDRGSHIGFSFRTCTSGIYRNIFCCT